MRQWDIVLFPFPSEDQPHPMVVISNDRICSSPDFEAVNLLACQTVRPFNRPPQITEVYLNSAEGLEVKTLVRCDFVYVFAKRHALEQRGRVCAARIEEIRKKFRFSF